ncbi:MAG: hypothetical protein DME18_02545 [Verrucomicrobia bacterium]|nr:MAG: hypothetical protein DME18_02545 [Verrucomicrobiota bacterium]
MNPGVLFLITTDPRTSPRPAEAVRIAAGLAAWRKLTVTVCLREPAVLALSEFPEELADGDNFSRYLPLVTESGGRICAQRNAPLLRVIGQAAVPYREINDEELATLVSETDYLIRF